MVSDAEKGMRALHQVWCSGLPEEAPLMWRVDFPTFAKGFITSAQCSIDAMPTPEWMTKLKAEVASKLPTTLPEGRTEFLSASMSEPKLEGKFRKYSFTCGTRDGRTINLSVSPTLLTRIISIVEAGENFAITKQGEGLGTNYIVEAWEEGAPAGKKAK